MSTDVSSADVPWERPRKNIRWYHEVHAEEDVQEILNKLEEMGYDMEDPELLEESSVPGQRSFLLSGVRKECDCAACRRAARRRRKPTSQDATEE